MSSEPENNDSPATVDAREIYTEAVIDHATRPRNLGEMQDPDGYARITGPCGDTMEIWLRARDSLITGISFLTDGCGTSLASGSMVTVLAGGKSVSDALQISQQDVLDALGDLPEDSRHCALLAANTLKAAVADLLAMQRAPWKKAYRKYQI